MEKGKRKTDTGGYLLEVEIFKESMPVVAESHLRWKNCRKNPGHPQFIGAREFKEKHLAKVRDDFSREWLSSCIDLTVRLRVHYTSRARPADDQFAIVKGTKSRRTGTGFIHRVYAPESAQPCPCVECDGKVVKKHWVFEVRTANHVIYNDEEARQTKVDLFLDDESCDTDEKLKSVWGVEAWLSGPKKDKCGMLCVTCDEDLGERLQSVRHCFDSNGTNYPDLDLAGQDFLPSCDQTGDLGMIASHPHGQPKKITVGEWRGDEEFPCFTYTVPTCAGSSGAPVFRLEYNRDTCKFDGSAFLVIPTIHSGSCPTDDGSQLNCGHFWYN